MQGSTKAGGGERGVAAMGPRHVGFGPGVIDEDQAGRIKPPLILSPLRPPPGDVRTILFAGLQAFFEADALVLEEVPHREVAHFDPARRELRSKRPQCDVGLLRQPELEANHARPPVDMAGGHEPCKPRRFRSPGTAETTSQRSQR